jgi:hypothetical protein
MRQAYKESGGDMNAITKQMAAACVAMSLCSVAGAAAAVDGGEKAGAPAGTVKSRTFNVLNYGAVGDDKTDNTEAFSACLKAVIAAGGGKMFNHHASRFGRVCAQRCTHAIAVTGRHGFSVEQLDIEIAGRGQTDENNKWQATAFDINDPNSLGSGDLNYWVVEGAVGAVEKFTRNGGAGIRARRIGSAPAGSK